MSLTPGQKLGPYEVVSPLGAGGMGEVYRARDTRLDRIVAIKILPSHLSADPIRKQRFEREAKSISGLNHPNICTLYDIGSQDGIDYLVMECVEGESLAQRLERGALPIDQILKIGPEIADALAKAHRNGIIHRDLKPANVMLTKSGAKLLDFGLARPVTPDSAITITAAKHSPVTEDGAIVGTFQYMSPEQLEGKELDGRSDLFSFGAVLYEMVTGQPAFSGKSQFSVASAILEKEPAPVSTIKPLSPSALDHVIRRCMAKDPDNRWQTARDVALELGSISQPESAPSPIKEVAGRAMSRRNLREWLAWGLAAVFFITTGYFLVSHRPSERQQKAFRASILPPDKHSFGRSALAVLSPDGRYLVLRAFAPSENDLLWLRPIDSLTARPLSGTEGGYGAFWSPDSQWIAFFAGGKLKKVSVDGGGAIVICNASQGRGGSWGPDGTILLVPGIGIPVYSVPATGGTPTAVTQLDKSRQEITHRWPAFLPDGKHFLFFSRGSQNSVYVGALGSTGRKLVLNNDSNAIYASPGYLLFVQNGNLMAQPFDTKQMQVTGTAVSIAENVPTDGITQHALFSASNNGVLSIQPKVGKLVEPVWVDHTGKVLERLGEPAMYSELTVSPDGQKAALVIFDPQDGSANTWILDLKGHQKTRLTFESSAGTFPVWSPKGNEILFSTNRLGVTSIYRIPASGVGEAKLFLHAEGFSHSPIAWSPDGGYIAFVRNPINEPNKRSLWIAPTLGDKSAYSLLGPSVEGAKFSPDGKWLAYSSDESGRDEVYVVPFPEVNRKVAVSSAGGISPAWSSDGRQLYYRGGDQTLMVATLQAGKYGWAVSKTESLFKIEDPNMIRAGGIFDVSHDGKQFLVFRDAEDQPTSNITLITNWTAALPK
jgi:serine/threonine protein kinase/Tol biopolymer transport system component